MALDLGTLVGRLELDGSSFDDTLGRLPGSLDASSKVLKVGAAAAAAGIGLALAGGLNSALDLQDVRAKLSAQLGLSAPDAQRLGAIAGKLYTSAYGESVEGVSEAVAQVVGSIRGMGDASDETIEAMTAKVLNFNTTFGTDTARVTQVVGQLLSTGLAADANEGMDLLTAAFQRVPEAVREDILDAADEYGPFFAQLGIDGTTAFGLLTNASEKGMYGIDKTGDALKEFTIRATDMSAASKVGYDALGMSQEDMTRKILAGGDSASGAFADIIHGLQSIEDPASQSQAALALFGTPLEDLGTGEIPAFLGQLDPMGDAFDSVAGAADKMGESINGTARTGWTEIQRQFEKILGQVGAQLLPVLGELTSWLVANPGAITAIAIGVGVLAVAFIALTVATWAMNTALLANPITWIVLMFALLAAAIVALILNWDAVVSFISGIWGGFVDWLTSSLEGLADWWSGVWDGFLGFLSDVWSNITTFLSDALQGLIDLFLTYHPLGIIIDNWGAIVEWFAGLPQAILDGIVTGWTAVVEWFTGLPEAIGSFLTDAGTWLVQTGYDMLTSLIAGYLVALVLISEWFASLPATIVGWLTAAGTWLISTGTALLTGLRDGIVAGWTAVSDWFTALPANIAAFVLTMSTWLLVHGTNLLTGLRDGIVAGYTTVVAWFQALPANITAFVMGMATWLLVHGSNLLNGLYQGIVTGYTIVSAWFTSLPSRVIGFLAGAASWLVSQGSSIMSGLSSGVSSGWSSVTAFLSSIPGRITGALSGAGTWLLNIGGNIIDGLVNGIKGAIGRVSAAVGQVAEDVKGKFANILGIHSPSLVFHGFGLNIGEGLIQGLAAIQPEVTGAVQGLVGVPDMPGMSMGADGTLYGDAGGARGPLVDARITVQGNVGWDEAEMARRSREQMERGLALAGLDEIVGVA